MACLSPNLPFSLPLAPVSVQFLVNLTPLSLPNDQQPHGSAALSSLRPHSPVRSHFPCCFELWFVLPLLILGYSSTSHPSRFVNHIWTRWLPPPSSWDTGHPPPREASCPGSAPPLAPALMWAYETDPFCPGGPLGGWQSGSLAVHPGTA